MAGTRASHHGIGLTSLMAEEDTGEKEFEASEQKRRKAREDGNIVQSRETTNLAVVFGLLAAASGFQVFLGEGVFQRLVSMLYHAEAFSSDVFKSNGGRTEAWIIGVLAYFSIPFIILASISMILIILTQSMTFSTKKIKPDFKKISPVSNLKKKYGAQGLVDFLRDAAKMIFAGSLATFFLIGFAEDFYAGSAVHIGQIGHVTFRQVVQLIILFGVFQFFLAAIDFPIQWRLHANKLRMSREELKKETKESEGDPLLKQSRREKASKMTNGEMLQNVKTATVIMVNPTHYAVALKWDPDSQKAPILVAKGVDHIAAKIRELAADNNVPIYRDPPSARSIYSLVEIGDEIEPNHFAAVAAAIQYVETIGAPSS